MATAWRSAPFGGPAAWAGSATELAGAELRHGGAAGGAGGEVMSREVMSADLFDGCAFDEFVASLAAPSPRSSALPPCATALPSFGEFDLATLESSPPLFSGATAVLPLAAGGAAPAAARDALRCIDGTHAAGCTRCTPAPALGDESGYELVGEAHKKNGEKRLRSQLARTPEWGSVDERARVARACDAAGPSLARLAAALRSRHCAELRKGDLMYLARTWGYRSDVWSRRKNRQYQQRAGAPPAPPPLQHALVPHAPPPPAPQLDRFAAESPAAQLASVHTALSGPLRVLAERSVAAFSEGGYESVLPLLRARGGRLPLPVLQAGAECVTGSVTHLTSALDNMRRLLGGLRQQHTDIQLSLLRLSPADGARPAFVVLSGKDAPWEVLMRGMCTLCDFAISCGSEPHGSATAAALAAYCAGAPGSPPSSDAPTSSGSTVADGADLEEQQLSQQLLSAVSKKEHIAVGGTLALELLTRVASMLAQLKLAPHETYLNAVSLSFGLMIGHLSATAAVLSAHSDQTKSLGALLAAAGAPLPADISAR